MPLDAQLLDIPFTGGLQEQIDKRIVSAGSFLRIDNAVYNQAGALEKRNGYGRLTTSIHGAGFLQYVSRLDVLNRTQLLTIGHNTNGPPTFYSYSSTNAAWFAKDTVCPATARREPAIRAHNGPVGWPFLSVAAGLYTYSYSVLDYGLMVKVVDPATGTVTLDESKLAAYDGFHVAFGCGGKVVFATLDDTTGALLLFTFDPVAQTVSAPVTVVTPGAGHLVLFDACVVDDATGVFALAYQEATTTTATVKTFNVATLTATHTATATVVAPFGIAINSNGASIALVVYDVTAGPSKDVRCACWTAALAVRFALTNVCTGALTITGLAVGFDQTGRVAVLWDGTLIANQQALFVQKLDLVGAPVGFRRQLYDASLYARPFLQDGLLYVLSLGYALLCLDDETSTDYQLTFCGTTALREAQGVLLPTLYPRPAPVQTTAQKQVHPLLVLINVPGNLANVTATLSNTGVDLSTLDFTAPQAGLWDAAQAQGCLSQTGSFLGWVDGQSCVEQGFARDPGIFASTVTAGAGQIEGADSPSTNQYGYVAVYEWLDEHGNLHQSNVSNVRTETVTLANTNASITLSLRCLNYTRRSDRNDGSLRPVNIAVFRTLKNAPETFYRLTPRSESVAAQVVSDPTAYSVTYVDTLKDSDVLNLGYGTLYTSGDVVENDFPPAAVAQTLHANRLWLISGEDDHTVWFSKVFVRFEAPGWSRFFTIRVDDSADGCTALASLDDKLIIFTRSRIYYVTGDGPNDTGRVGQFQGPLLVSTGGGCLDSRSVVTFENGVLFQGPGGIYLLTPQLTVEWVGAPVRGQLKTHPRITSAVDDADRGRVIFAAEDDEGNGIFLVYDYLRACWYTWSITESARQLGQTFWDGFHTYSDVLGVCRESYGSHPGLDPGATGPLWPVTTIETPWMRPGPIAGYERTRHVLFTTEKKSYHEFTVEVLRGFDDVSVSQSKTFNVTATAVPTISDGDPAVWDLHVKASAQKTAAIKVRISDNFPTPETIPEPGTDWPTAAGPLGFSIAGLTLELGLKKGRWKLPATKKG